jgi:hypothetical protein
MPLKNKFYDNSLFNYYFYSLFNKKNKRQQYNNNSKSVNEIATQTGNSNSNKVDENLHKILNKITMKFNPIVIITTPVAASANTAVKMVCPSIEIIGKHCPYLAQSIEVSCHKHHCHYYYLR